MSSRGVEINYYKALGLNNPFKSYLLAKFLSKCLACIKIKMLLYDVSSCVFYVYPRSVERL